jgi:hypothetical protein
MSIGIVWMILCAKHWREILTVQHFISGVIFFLMVEMAFNWGYWDDYNKAGESCKQLLLILLFFRMVVFFSFPSLILTQPLCLFFAFLQRSHC